MSTPQTEQRSACDYHDCPRYLIMVTRPVTHRHRNTYCTIECRNAEIKRRLAARGHKV